MKSIIILILTLSLLLLSNSNPNPSFTASKPFSIPDTFTASQTLFTLGADVFLQDGNGWEGRVKQEFWALRKLYQLRDGSGRVWGSARQRLWAIGAAFDIMDGDNEKIGSIEQPLYTHIDPIFDYFHIYDKEQKLVSIVRYYPLLSVFSTGVQIYDASEKKQAYMTRKIHLYKRKWTIQKVLENQELPFEVKMAQPFLVPIISWLQNLRQLSQMRNRRNGHKSLFTF